MDLTFVNTFSLSDFKGNNGITKIDIIKNPNSGKLFFSCYSTKLGRISGAVSSDYRTNTMVSRVVAGADEFYLIHKAGSNPEENIQDTL